MNAQETLARLEALGKEKTRQVYRRHGVGENQYGVGYGDLGRLQKQIRKDHALAHALWDSGNHDARVLATMVADPGAADEALLLAWVRDLDSYPLADAFTGFAARTPHARALMERWTGSDGEWVARVGWGLLGRLAMDDRTLPDAFFEPWLERIERGIHAAKNRVREAMNMALIAIGIRSAGLEEKAIDAARRIGPVDVDHGETNCETPAAEPYIRKARARRKA